MKYKNYMFRNNRIPAEYDQNVFMRNKILLTWSSHNRRGITTNSILLCRFPANRDVMFASKMGQIGPKWEKSETFPDHAYLLTLEAFFFKNLTPVLGEPKLLKSDLKRSQICLMWSNLTHFESKPGIHSSE